MNAATAVRRIANNPVHTKIYNTFFRSTSTMVATAIVGSLVLETVVDSSVNQVWNVANRGVSHMKINCKLIVFIQLYNFFLS
jgi:hypothetical protein